MADLDFDEETTKRSYGKPYGAKHPIPTIQGYREHREKLNERLEDTERLQDAKDEQQDGDSKVRRAYESVKTIFKEEDQPKSSHDPYPTANRNDPDRRMRQDNEPDVLHRDEEASKDDNQTDKNVDSQNEPDDGAPTGQEKSATETATQRVDPKQKRKDMKKIKRTGGVREVTDPVTHLPVKINDQTDKDLRHAPQNEPAPGSHHRTATGLSGASKTREQLQTEAEELHKGHRGSQKLFPPPDFQETKEELKRTYQLALTFGLTAIGSITVLALFVIILFHSRSTSVVQSDADWLNRKTEYVSHSWPWVSSSIVLAIAAGGAFFLTTSVTGWLGQKVDDIFEDETWDADRQAENKTNESDDELPESVAWLNSVLASVWPLMNPDLFASLADTLEDVMQASLPKVIRMVSIDDLGQGSESIRILGIRWLPTGAAAQSVDAQGKIEAPEQNNDQGTDRNSHENQINYEADEEKADSDGDDHADDTTGQAEQQEREGDKHKKKKKKETPQEEKQRQQEQQAIKEGMKAEEGDFMNMELAFAYRAQTSGKSLKSKAKNAHLYLKFYLPGGIAIPVWVELRGIVGLMRLRLQLTPDPPFFSLCTLTFLGQPRASLSCVPLSKHNLNLMDVPLISSFVQSAIDAALAEYVAPKSMTLDLKGMLVGDDFKKDTVSKGVVLVFIKQARGFKEGDGGIGPMKGSSDAYVTLSWGKFGKPMASTRIIEADQQPNWHEWSSILVSPDELNAHETLRVQLWDSDKWTADDDLGRVEVPLHDLMHSPKTKNQMMEREDGFTGEDPDEKMPGTLTWSVGYFAKAHIQESELQKQTFNTEIRTKKSLKEHVSKTATAKLREATTKDESKELKQQKLEDYKELETEMIISAPPPDNLPCGILSIQIHNITGLEIAKSNRSSQNDDQDAEDEAEQSNDIPDSYCTIMLNHQKIYRTRTKPKNAKPFFNAGTERFVRDWKTTEVMVSVRDSREREDDALLGIVYLPLRKLFEERSQVMSTFPLAGGIGYGRARISLVWRSVDLKMPKELTGWDYGTLEIKSPIRVKSGGQSDMFQGLKMKLKSQLSKGKMHWNEDSWCPKRRRSDGSVYLAFRKRYASPLTIEFQKTSVAGTKSVVAFSVFWLNEIPDEEEKQVSLRVWRGGKENFKRASNCCDYEGLEQDEQSLGEVELTLRFWRGLSGYHKSFAAKSRNGDVRDVMEVLDTVNDEGMADDDSDQDDDDDSYSSDSESESAEATNAESRTQESPEDAQKRKMLRKAKKADCEDEQNDESDDDDEENIDGSAAGEIKSIPGRLKKRATTLLNGEPDKDDGSRGALAQIQDYKRHHKQLHRQHRGVMQWKTARTLDWALGKLNRGRGRVGELFEHSEKGQGIETEV